LAETLVLGTPNKNYDNLWKFLDLTYVTCTQEFEILRLFRICKQIRNRSKNKKVIDKKLEGKIWENSGFYEKEGNYGVWTS